MNINTSIRTNFQANTRVSVCMHYAILLRGKAAVLQTNGKQTVKFVGLPRPFYTNTRIEIQTRIEAIAC